MWPTIREAHRSLARRDINVTRLCTDSFKAIDATRNLNAFITLCKDQAFEKASNLDQHQYQDDGNLLHGIPISIKDNFCTKQVLTTCGSKMLYNFVPPYNATIVDRLLKANCLMVGKTNMDEFAMGSSCTTSFFKNTANYSKHHLLGDEYPNEVNSDNWFMAGGSSTGSAVSVASGSCFASIGTDTGGSTRQPASLNGVVGFKPTYGLISRHGLIPLAHCLDVVSILARTVDDVGIVFDKIVGEDENDLTSIDHSKNLKPLNSRKSIRVGVPDEFISRASLMDSVERRFAETLSRLSKLNLGIEIVKIHLPNAYLATECYTIISSAEIASNMSCYDGVKYGLAGQHEAFKGARDAGFGPEVKKRILLGNYFLLSSNRERYLTQALKLRRLISDDFDRAFKENQLDVIMMPSTPSTSVSYSEWLRRQDNNKLFLEDYFLIPSNLANIPSISIPNGRNSDGLPIGLQLMANRFDDVNLISRAKFFEELIEQI